MIIIRLLILLVLLCHSTSWAAVATDSIANSYCQGNASPACTTGNTQLVYAHTNSGSVTNMAVAVFVSCTSGTTISTVSGVTYAGTSLTQLETISPVGARNGYLFGWPSGSAPTTGTNNVVVTLSTSLLTGCPATQSTVSAISMSVTGSTTTSQYVDTNIDQGSGATASLTMTSNPTGSMGFSAGCAGDGITSSSEGAIDVSNSITANSCGTSFGMDVSPTDAAWSFTIPSDSWIMTGAVFADAGGGGGGSTPHNLPMMGAGQ